ncbi:MAG: penicillin acylase family protein [Robiginitomaculum sp.]|nr:penicillin acylase family protein [Robiginitomaculum sp.]
MKTVLRWAGWTLAGLITISLFAAGGLYWRLQRALPQVKGELTLTNLASQVKIARVNRGIAHIFASSRHDAFYALGVAHAQDRMFQMDMSRRFGSGRLSELVGKRAVSTDAQMRILGLRRAAEGSWNHLTPEEQAAITAYTDGVNAIITAKDYVPPAEYVFLRARPEPWVPADTLTVFKVMAYSLAGDAMQEPGRKRLREILGQERLEQFLPAYPKNAPVALREEDMTSVYPAPVAPVEEAPAPAIGPAMGEQIKGSNNWVVDGSLSKSGLPLLANDPHLALTAPGIWYYARLNAPDMMVLGVTLPGTPFVTLGRNRTIAWGFTNTGPDTSDLKVVKTNTLHPTTITETIKVKGGDDVKLDIAFAKGAVVLDPKWYKIQGMAKDDETILLYTTLDDDDDTTASIGMANIDARSFEDFDKALRRFKMPEQNMVYADINGNIGFVSPARVPVRDADGNWIGEIPYEALPRTKNPGRHYVATANNKIVPDSYPYFITNHWYGFHRIRRIVENIEATPKHSIDSFKAMQMDTVSDLARRTLPLLASATPETKKGQVLRDMVVRWDGNLAPGRPEGLIYAGWMRAFSKLVYADDLGDDFERFWTPRRGFMERVVTGDNANWCDDINTEEHETCQTMAGRAFDKAATALGDAYGKNPQKWRWGAVHEAVFAHPLFGGIPILKSFFSVRVPVGGDGSTPNVAHYSYKSGNFDAPWGPSMRAIYDLSDMNASLYMSAPGQSGQVLSKHYRDMAKSWAKGEYIQIRDDWTPASPPQGTQILVLNPQ